MARKSNEVKGLIFKTWERCRSIGVGSKGLSADPFTSNTKTPSWPSSSVSPYRDDKSQKRGRTAPEGCFSVYVGQEKQRFVIRTDCINHPLFKVLLEEAELEYGYNSDGPLTLPCKVDMFCKVIEEMDGVHQRCNFVKGSYGLVSPSK